METDQVIHTMCHVVQGWGLHVSNFIMYCKSALCSVIWDRWEDYCEVRPLRGVSSCYHGNGSNEKGSRMWVSRDNAVVLVIWYVIKIACTLILSDLLYLLLLWEHWASQKQFLQFRIMFTLDWTSIWHLIAVNCETDFLAILMSILSSMTHIVAKIFPLLFF